MPRDEISKHTLNLRAGDWDYIESIYKPRGIATAVVVRSLVSRFVDAKRSGEDRTDLKLEASL